MCHKKMANVAHFCCSFVATVVAVVVGSFFLSLWRSQLDNRQQQQQQRGVVDTVKAEPQKPFKFVAVVAVAAVCCSCCCCCVGGITQARLPIF